MSLSFDKIRLPHRWDSWELLRSGDVILILLLVSVTIPVQWLSTSSPLRALFGLPLLLFFPGYALLLLLFPRRHAVEGHEGRSQGSLRHVERFALSFGISLTLAPIVALGYALFDIQLTQPTVTVGFSVITAGLLVAGEIRRRQLPRSERFVVPFARWLGTFRSSVRRGSYDIDTVLNIALVFAVVFALSSLGYGLLVPNSGEQYTNLYLVTENGAGEFVAGDYPVNLTDGEPGQLIVGIDNHEGRAVDYQLVVQLQRISLGENGSGDVHVLDHERLQHRSLSVPSNGTLQTTLFLPTNGTIANSVDAPTGTYLRLTYLLYLDEAPEEQTTDNAYRSVYLWLDTNQSGPDVASSIERQGGATTRPRG